VTNNIIVPRDGPWPPSPYLQEQPPGRRTYSATNILDFPTFIRIVEHWRWLVLGLAVAGLAGGLVFTLLTTPVYRAWVTLQANPPSFEVTDRESRDDNGSPVGSADFVATQVGLVSSKAVAERTAQNLNLANNSNYVSQNQSAPDRLREATQFVEGGLKVIPPDEGQLIKFSFDSTSPQLSADVANGLADSFIDTAIQRRYQASAYARNFLERQISKTRSDLDRSERSLATYAQQQGIISTATGPDGQPVSSDSGSLQGASLMKLNDALSEATARRVAAEGAYRQSLTTGPTSDITSSTAALQQQRATLEADYQQKLIFLKADHPQMQSLRAQISALDKQISRQAAQMSQGRNNTLLAEYRGALAAERALQARVGQLKASVLDLRGRSIQYNILQREVDTNRSLYDALLQRYKQIGVAGAVGLAPISIVDRADPPATPFKPNLLIDLLGGLAVGLLAGLSGAVALELVNDTIKTREDVREKLGLACLGSVPKTAARESFVDDLRNPSSIVSEAYSAVVAALRFSTDEGAPRTFLITSTRAGEGKSSTALAIAQNFARRGNRVLLIDSDLRKPAFKAADEARGLSKLLTSDDPIADHITATPYDNLSLLPSGPLPPNPADLLSTGRIRKIAAEAANAFDIVIVDGPPTLGLADAPLLAAAVGNILFVIESGKTRTRAAVEALNRLEATRAQVLGVTLTKAAASGGPYGYKRYGYGEYSYGADRRVPRTEILMIPDIPGDAPAGRSADG